MEGIAQPRDLILLESLSRELQNDLREALEAGVPPRGLLIELGVDPVAIGLYTLESVASVDRTITRIHGEGMCGCTHGLMSGIFMEAFVLGLRFKVEKGVWDAAEMARMASTPPPDEPQSPQA